MPLAAAMTTAAAINRKCARSGSASSGSGAGGSTSAAEVMKIDDSPVPCPPIKRSRGAGDGASGSCGSGSSGGSGGGVSGRTTIVLSSDDEDSASLTRPVARSPRAAVARVLRRLLAAGCWLLAAGCGLWAAGCGGSA